MGIQLFKKKSEALKNEQLRIKVLKNNICAWNSDDFKVEILKIGKLIEGIAYFHETDEYYKVVGHDVQVKTTYTFDGKTTEEVEFGFYGVWKGKSHTASPFTFEMSNYRSNDFSPRYENGYGDSIEVEKVYN